MWSVVTGAYAVLLLAVSVIPVKADVKIPHLDKVVHLYEYLVFAWLLVQAVRASSVLARGEGGAGPARFAS